MDDVVALIKQSKTYQIWSRIRQWVKQSTVGSLLTDERVLSVAIGLFLLLSVVRVLSSSMDEPVKFLSFIVLFVVLVVVTWNVTDPRAKT